MYKKAKNRKKKLAFDIKTPQAPPVAKKKHVFSRIEIIAVIAAVVFTVAVLFAVFIAPRLTPGNITADGLLQTRVYFINPATYNIEHELYSVKNGTPESMLSEVLNKCLLGPSSSHLTKTSLDEVIDRDMGIRLDNQARSVEVTFLDNFKNLSNAHRVYLVTALTYTLTEFEFVEGVTYHIGGEALSYTGDSTAEDISGSAILTRLDTSQSASLTFVLYFADKDGTGLIAEERQVTKEANINQYLTMMEELIKGPVSENLVRTLPSDTKIISVTLDANVIHVTLSAEFTDKFAALAIPAELSVYSIVNTLTGGTNQLQVQILVNSTKLSDFNGMDLSGPLDKDESLILQAE